MYRKAISIRSALVLLFIASMLLSIGGIGYLLLSRWRTSATETMQKIAEDINDKAYGQVAALLQAPMDAVDVNRKLIENGIVDMQDDKLRDRYFVSVLGSLSDQIYSFSYGSADGEYYGARRNEAGIIEIMRNDSRTGGNSWYYSVDDNLEAGDVVLKAGRFDPRTRAWYIGAVSAAGTTFSPIYKHFVMDDLSISAARPIYAEDGSLEGVLGAHMLISEISMFLSSSVREYSGMAVIAEKSTGLLVANSMGEGHFADSGDGTIVRRGIDDLKDQDIRIAYESYAKDGTSQFRHKGEKGGYYVNVRELQFEGIDWVAITAVPEAFLLADISESIQLAAILAALTMALAAAAHLAVTRVLLRPVSHLLEVSGKLSSGDLSHRARVLRDDELGGISKSLNSVADKMEDLISNLEAKVSERTRELNNANVTLEESRGRLQLLLDSTAEAIFGIDMEGICTFCNASSLAMLGYESQEDLLGENMHLKIHHSHMDGSDYPAEDCRIYKSIWEGRGYKADDEVFWRADGTSFEVEYNAYPQIKDGAIVGGVITFMDITDRKRKEEEIRYLSCHDVLTGLHNRSCFEKNLGSLDVDGGLPLSVVFADINGLKMTNDIFGHAAGDQLIRKAAEILKSSCREGDSISRVGGDEFIIILPRTGRYEAEEVVSKIRKGFLDARIAAVKCSISLGIDTKSVKGQPIEAVIANAENAMYQDKTMNRESVNKALIDTLVETLYARSPRERKHSEAVSQLCGELGAAMGLSETRVKKLMRAGYLHDIGKITLDQALLSKSSLTGEEFESMRQHSAVGYRILNLFDDTLDLAEPVYSHHERWDGRGYPRGLKGEQIPLLSRIIYVVETYDRVINGEGWSRGTGKKEAIEEIRKGAGTQFDPAIAERFAKMMEEKDAKY